MAFTPIRNACPASFVESLSKPTKRAHMVTPMLHRRWAREYLAHAERTPQSDRKRRYLRLAVSNTVCAHRLEAWNQRHTASANEHEEKGSAINWLSPKR